MGVEGLPSGKQLLAQIMRDVDSGTGAFAGAIVTTEKMDPVILPGMRESLDEVRVSLGLPKMFEGLLDDVRSTRVSGATPEQTVELIVDKLRTTTTPWQIYEELPPLREAIGGFDLPPALDSLRAQTLEQLKRNLDRMDGRIDDGFGRYPDYAELGGALANTELMLNIHRAGTTKSDDAVRAAVGTLEERLDW